MKKWLRVIGLAAMLSAPAFGSVNIDSTTFPDAAFRSYVSTNFDENSDGILSDAEIAKVTQIDVSNTGVANLMGIENFTELEKLDCSGNDLRGVSSTTSNFAGLVPLHLFKQFKELTCDFRCRYIDRANEKFILFSYFDFISLYATYDIFDTSYVLMVWFDYNGRNALITPQILPSTNSVIDAVKVDLPLGSGDPVMLEFRTTGTQNITVRIMPILQ